MPTLSDIIRRTRLRLNEPATPTSPSGIPRYYTDTQITDWINDGLRDVSRRAETLITYDTSIQLPPSTQNTAEPVPTYPLPTDIIRIHRIEYEVTGDSSQKYPMNQSSREELDRIWNVNQLSQSTYPTWWVTTGYPGGIGRNQFAIQVYPLPAQQGQLNIFYYRLPLRLQDPITYPAEYNTMVDMIAGWDDMVVDYAVVQALIAKQDSNWQAVQQMYEQKITNIIDQTRHFGDQPQTFQYEGVFSNRGYFGDDGWDW